MSKQQTALRLALEALETCGVVDYEQDFDHEKVDEAITALREALAEQPAQQEPVKGAALNKDGGVTLCKNGQEESIFGFAGRLFTSPPAQRTWVGLMDEEIQKEFHPLHATGLQFARAIEAKLKEKNNG